VIQKQRQVKREERKSKWIEEGRKREGNKNK
jgi:hypothetical protein